MSYHKGIIEKLKDSDNWPGPQRAHFLDELNNVADETFNKKTTEGQLAAFLIYHQLTEEILRIIIDCSIFYIQLGVFPQEYSRNSSNGNIFGQIIQELKQSMLDDNTKRLIDQSQKLNALRIRMVHKLILESTLPDIRRQCKQAKKIFDNIFDL